MLLRVAIVLALVTGLALPAAVAQPKPDPRVQEEAAARYDRGVKLFDAGDYTGALAEFEAVYKLTSRWEVLFNVAVTQKKLFRYGAAVRTLERYLAEGGAGIDAPRRQAVERELAEIRALVAEITVIVEGAPARIEVDGLYEGDTPLSRPLLLGSGRHVIRASRDGELPDERSVDVVSGQNATVTLTPRPRPVEKRTASVTIDSNPPGATLVIDGKPVGKAPWTGELEQGGHRVRATIDGYSPADQEVSVAGGQTRRVTIDLVVLPPPVAPPLYKRPWFWVGVGALTAAAVATTVLVIANQPESYDVNVTYP
jgi:hypothetical protein